MERTMKELGRPWAEEYRGSHRLTGQTAPEPVRMENGEVAPGWVWVGDMTETEFWRTFEAEEADYVGR